MTPAARVIWAADFNYVAAFTLWHGVRIHRRRLIDLNKVDNLVIFAGLVGAIVWD